MTLMLVIMLDSLRLVKSSCHVHESWKHADYCMQDSMKSGSALVMQSMVLAALV